MAAKPTDPSGKRLVPQPPVPDPATDAFPAEEDVSVPPPGSDQTLGTPDPATARKGRPRKPE